MAQKDTRKPTRGAGATRARILRVARRLVARHGHEQLSLRDVARRARISAPSMYEHFDGRDGLLRALSNATRAELRQRVTEVFATDRRLHERLLDACLAYLTFAEDHPRDFELCFLRSSSSSTGEVPTDSPLVPVWVAVENALATGELRAPEGLGALEMVLALWAQAHGLAVLRMAYVPGVEGFRDRASASLNAVIRAWKSGP